jgi:hypothetical protein
MGNYLAYQERILDSYLIRNILHNNHSDHEEHNKLGFPNYSLHLYHNLCWSRESFAFKYWFEKTLQSMVLNNMVLFSNSYSPNHLPVLCITYC